jgi:transcriptional regulator with XRE-family HTH domain
MAGKYTPTAYGQRLKRALVLAGYGLGEDELREGAAAKLAKALKVSTAAVGMVLSGQTKQFTPENSARAARFLKVDHFWLATGEGEPRPPGLSEAAAAFGRRYDSLGLQQREGLEKVLDILARPGVTDAEVEKAMPITATRPRQTHDHEET